jgi:hypothetical protein
MRTESALVSSVATAERHGTPMSRGRRGDMIAVVVLVALPLVIFGVSALLGHADLPGDDLTQNLPLRALAGRDIRAGQLPLFNPYIWSGAPLLAGWNAAAAYPLTWLFAILPSTAAWTVGMISPSPGRGTARYRGRPSSAWCRPWRRWRPSRSPSPGAWAGCAG